jgi:hypothetical protein
VLEFRKAELGDPRLVERAASIVQCLELAPSVGFPQALRSRGATEAFYRFLRNPRVRYRALMQAHALETVGRMQQGSTVRVVHDTTELSFGGQIGREGLGRMHSKTLGQGFFAHASLAMTVDTFPVPLGVVGLNCWARTKAPRRSRKLSGGELAKLSDRESERWPQQVGEVEALVGKRASVIHLMDREGDAYPLLCKMVEEDSRFVVRMARDRLVFTVEEDGEEHGEISTLSEELNQFPVVLEREVPLARRTSSSVPKTKLGHSERVARTAKLSIRAGRVALRRPRYVGDEQPESLSVNVVYVQEIDEPDDAEPITWVLVTSEPIALASQVAAVIDHYRARWTIEEFFKALKSGCAIEDRQLESFHTLTNALALLVPIAWQMLLLRALSRATPDAPAEQVLTSTQIKVLRHEQPQKMPATSATVKHALYAVAGMGGHLKSNGPPGWMTLARGMQSLITLANAWESAWASIRSDPEKM